FSFGVKRKFLFSCEESIPRKRVRDGFPAWFDRRVQCAFNYRVCANAIAFACHDERIGEGAGERGAVQSKCDCRKLSCGDDIALHCSDDRKRALAFRKAWIDGEGVFEMLARCFNFACNETRPARRDPAANMILE